MGERGFYVKGVQEEQSALTVLPGKWWVLLEGWDGPPQVGTQLREPAQTPVQITEQKFTWGGIDVKTDPEMPPGTIRIITKPTQGGDSQ